MEQKHVYHLDYTEMLFEVWCRFQTLEFQWFLSNQSAQYQHVQLINVGDV
jgi:hypothetical protein